jgi:hypothetical protein
MSKMAIANGSSQLPNLKIEIENDLDETMVIDDNENIETKACNEDGPEEGELSDSKDTDTEVKPPMFGLALSTSSEPVWVMLCSLYCSGSHIRWEGLLIVVHMTLYIFFS